MSTDEPHIVIVGRQNVGKSTLYNRLLRKRIAITHSTPGVTRDLLWEGWSNDEVRYRLCDTGGQTTTNDGVEAHVTQRAQEACRLATVILFVLDIHNLTAEDETVAASLIPYRERVICVLNKADHPQAELLIGDFFRLGFKTLVVISAQHNRHLYDLKDAIAKMTPTPAEPPTPAVSNGAAEPTVPETEQSADLSPPTTTTTVRYRVAIIGKPNVGKSTLINALTKTSTSIVWSHPGTTRDSVRGQHSFVANGQENIIELIDTAGLRRERAITDAVEYYSFSRAQEAVRNADITLLLIDSNIGLTDGDKKIARYATDQGRGVILVQSKIDMVARSTTASKARAEQIRGRSPHLVFVPLVEISALTGQGLPQLTDEMAQLWTVLNRRIPTPQLNRIAKEWMGGHHHRHAHFMYAAQIGINPLRFAFFFKRIRSAPRTLPLYLINNLRNHFHLRGAPILLKMRDKSYK